MSAVVGGWMDELAKLKEKVRARRPFLSSAKKDQQFAKEGHVEEKEAKEDNKETTMSEATVCLLMDRFVPW
ncbi:hypothetical protein QQP08_007652 [Theobroma cacao]|uniref:Uncharacterized protein n=1 Tax=Theobroma cacao TaxID=3641 RepID=A0A061E4P7_THECC|nr:Uncharacterized protein TCM_006292 [Theobroma cacao]WRX15165.1 hypothetical protein QQP08_007652 [Theobroma cacao]